MGRSLRTASAWIPLVLAGCVAGTPPPAEPRPVESTAAPGAEPVAPAPAGPPYQYPPGYYDGFMEGCLGEGGVQELCDCSYEKLTWRFSVEDIDAGAVTEADLEQITAECMSGI